MATFYSTQEVADLAGVTYRQIDHWVRRGFLPFEIGVTSEHRDRLRVAGRGAREWTAAQMHFMKRFAALVRAGVRPDAVADAMATLDPDVSEFNLSKEVRVAVEV